LNADARDGSPLCTIKKQKWRDTELSKSTEDAAPAAIELEGFYNGMGEGVLAELRENGVTKLFNRQGLQHRIIEGKQNGADTSTEEDALAKMNSVMMPRAT